MAKRFGVQLDLSRNAVMKPEQIKEFATVMKRFGYNTIQLYTEDTYEIPDEPYFGYLRGRYSREELKDIVSFCESIGMEVIPSIQTLAHIVTIFRWGPYKKIHDIDDVMLVGDEKTYGLIEKMFATTRECYPNSRYVNIGMDEAHRLGLGKYMDKNGYEPAMKIFLRHLERVIDIAKKYDFQPLMWSDMFFRIEHGGAYEYLTGAEEPILSEETLSLCPEGVDQVFWRYHDTNKENYARMLAAHKKFKGETWFAGGAWTWKGFVGNNAGTLATMGPAMEACREQGIDNIVITTWGDDGKECSFWALLPSLFATRKLYDGVTDMEAIKAEFETLTGESFDHMMLLDLPMDYGKISATNKTPHKFMLYNDLFVGIFDPTVREGVAEAYGDLSCRLASLARSESRFAYLYQNMACLARTLAKKYDLGVRTRAAYQAGEKNILGRLVEDYDEVIVSLEQFVAAYRALWLRENKPFGLEVHEHRLGGLLFRIRMQRDRLVDFAEGRIDSIPELAENLLPYWENSPQPISEETNMAHVNSWKNSITVNRI